MALNKPFKSNCSLKLESDHNNHTNYYNGVMVIVVGNGHGDTSSNPGQD